MNQQSEPSKTDLDALFSFLVEVDREKTINRQTYLSDGSRKENDAEHAWHLAVMALLLSGYANQPVDVLRTISILLIHDLVEIDAGDTYAYDNVGRQTQQARELKAADRIFALLPEPHATRLRAMWDEFEAGETPEARFANAIDRIQPLMLHAAAGGMGWTENNIHLSQILERNRHSAQGSQALWDFAYRNFILPNLEKGAILP